MRGKIERAVTSELAPTPQQRVNANQTKSTPALRERVAPRTPAKNRRWGLCEMQGKRKGVRYRMLMLGIGTPWWWGA